MCVCRHVQVYLLLYFFYVGAVRRNRLLASVSRSEVENVVKIWLRYACDRDGRRQLRKRQLNDRRGQSHFNPVLSDSDVENQ